jgi:hypothetical protein
VRPEVVEQLEHWAVHEVDIGHPQLRLLGGLNPFTDLRVELLRLVPFHVRANAAERVEITSGSWASAAAKNAGSLAMIAL